MATRVIIELDDMTDDDAAAFGLWLDMVLRGEDRVPHSVRWEHIRPGG